ncbi:DUF4181 domain-containing protein [Oceanobacillus rekensis]|uniref:DUF4181 domain-containing protein n=1 Tax=Oceanobacillus rekensis TaxID=937927 RepID=UPI0015931D9A|nr:DUF4181 domain-containing protein [Oceanobacillus rekensis]
MDVFIFLACFIVYVVLSEWWLKKKYSIKRKKGMLVKHVNKTHKKMEGALFIIVILGILFLSKGIYAHYWLFSYLISLGFIRSMVKWKYERERREYILELNGLFSIITFVIIGFNTSII